MSEENLDEEKLKIRESLLLEVRKGKIPCHIGIIMDGNGRWAKAQGFNRIKGHQVGARNVKKLVRFADKVGVKYLSLYAFSLENWARPSIEVSALMKLIHSYIVKERLEMHAEGVKFRISGRVNELAPEIIEEARKSYELTKNNSGLTLNLCINYGGRGEIVDAVKSIIRQGIPVERIDDKLISSFLYSPDIPDPDLIIRTSGEMRISNFLLWECAYSEIYVTPAMWPEFDDLEFLKAVISFQRRERRYGKTGEQVR